MDLRALIAEGYDVLDELARDGQAPLISLASLKRKGPTSQHYGGSSGNKTGAARPSNVNKGDSTQAGVKHKDTSDGTRSGVRHKDAELSKTFKRDSGAKHKGPVPQTKSKAAATKAGKSTAKGGGEKPSCPGGNAPRMVFGKWRCAAPQSKGASQAKSRIAKKRQSKKKAPAPKGALGKLVHKARSALLGLFK